MGLNTQPHGFKRFKFK